MPEPWARKNSERKSSEFLRQLCFTGALSIAKGKKKEKRELLFFLALFRIQQKRRRYTALLFCLKVAFSLGYRTVPLI